MTTGKPKDSEHSVVRTNGQGRRWYNHHVTGYPGSGGPAKCGWKFLEMDAGRLVDWDFRISEKRKQGKLNKTAVGAN